MSIKLPPISSLTDSIDFHNRNYSHNDYSNRNPKSLPPISSLLKESNNNYQRGCPRPQIPILNSSFPCDLSPSVSISSPSSSSSSSCSSSPSSLLNSSTNNISYSPIVVALPASSNSSQSVLKKKLQCECCQCDSTPEWRRGPNGARTLCNACGLYFAKIVKRKGLTVAMKEMERKKTMKSKIRPQNQVPSNSPSYPAIDPNCYNNQYPQHSQMPMHQQAMYYPPQHQHVGSMGAGHPYYQSHNPPPSSYQTFSSSNYGNQGTHFR
ncbi:Gat4 protein [Saccharomycopsis crataegensis]|uniref:Gat4 protein n=1 Tax=Saccharomycopsis crataegensis TaxID=43959 RepID=A0AAV5QN76_9ASCO|nr:Gat4 protein [Saccharomycopsis crataegensis]